MKETLTVKVKDRIVEVEVEPVTAEVMDAMEPRRRLALVQLGTETAQRRQIRKLMMSKTPQDNKAIIKIIQEWEPPGPLEKTEIEKLIERATMMPMEERRQLGQALASSLKPKEEE